MRARSRLRHLSILALGVLAVALGCLQIAGLDDIKYQDDFCKADADCDDKNPCTIDTCEPDDRCAHNADADAVIPDGIQGNCLALECIDGVPKEVPLPEDVDDGDDCTNDKCGASGATHTVQVNAQCTYRGGRGLCDSEGACRAECGYLDDMGAEVGCTAASDPCSPRYCDKARGTCEIDVLDGVALPGTTPGECGGSYCTGGARQDLFEAAGTPCLIAGAAAPGRCDGAGQCVQCGVKQDCDDGVPESECHAFDCVGGACVYTDQPDGPLAVQVAGDCLEKTCANRVFSEHLDDNDLPVDNNDCTDDVCAGGVPSNPPLAMNTPCGAGGLLYCNGSGVCSGCTMDNQCGGKTECQTPVCDLAQGGQCAFAFVDAGVAVSMQVAGDCTTIVCDGSGGLLNAFAINDPQGDANGCTTDTCVAMGVTQHTPVPSGQTCNDNGGVVCDAAAHCVGKPCSMQGDCLAGTFCVDGVCCESMCGGMCSACIGAKKGGGPNGLCGPIMVGDPDNECPGNGSCNAGACMALSNGSPCVGAAGECASGNCIDGVCCNFACIATCQACNLAGSVGQCANVPANQDPANECPSGACDGMASCRLDNGQSCALSGQCLSNVCVDGVCCNAMCGGTCQACNLAGNLGACTPVPNNQDPANECANGACNGAAQCKLDNGQSCAVGNDCLSGLCADGVCCNTTCGGTCKACNLAGTVGTCANIPIGQDPSNECAGAATCNGGGACVGSPNGSVCTMGSECQSGNCVDGVCCSNATCAICATCNGATPGTCSSIAAGQPDNFPANACTGNNSCNGMSGASACRKNNGQTCAGNADCVYAHCVDGYCCDQTCNGTCQACSTVRTGVANGTCASIVANTDPDNECSGSQVCSGMGTCVGGPNGTTCMTGVDCASTFCVDGYCCNNGCNATCVSCNGAFTVGGVNGTCDYNQLNTDPDNDCPGAQFCDGAGMCN